MRIGFCLFKYFPFGGLQRDFLRIALECRRRGHHIRVYVFEWHGEQPESFEVIRVPKKGLSSPARNRAFVDYIQQHIKHYPLDCLVGFNKIPGLDFYYAADGCLLGKIQQRGAWQRLMPRYRHFLNYEAAIFQRGQHTEILTISTPQTTIYRKLYDTESERLHPLPPGISPDRRRPQNAQQVRTAFRAAFNLKTDEWLWLMLGSGFKTKGVDRTLYALHALPTTLRNKTKLFIIGQDNPAAFEKLAKKLGIGARVRFMRGRSDIPRFLLGADLLVHPAYHENTGTVLLEALVAGLPVLATDVCGYASYIAEAKAGLVLDSPFQQTTMNDALQQMMQRDKLAKWQDNGLTFAQSANIYQMPQRAVDIIELRKRNKTNAH